MAHKFDPKHLQRLESDERRRLLDVETVLTYLPLEPQQSVADIGCGPGFFAFPLSRRLASGRLYALDISDEMLERLRQRVQESQIANIEVMKCGELDFPLPAASLDGVFLAFVLHEQDNPDAFLAKVQELLKPGAWLSVIEWEKRDTDMGPPAAERIDRTELRNMARQHNLEVIFEKVLNEAHYLAVLRRRNGQMGRDAS